MMLANGPSLTAVIALFSGWGIALRRQGSYFRPGGRELHLICTSRLDSSEALFMEPVNKPDNQTTPCSGLAKLDRGRDDRPAV